MARTGYSGKHSRQKAYRLMNQLILNKNYIQKYEITTYETLMRGKAQANVKKCNRRNGIIYTDGSMKSCLKSSYYVVSQKKSRGASRQQE